MWYLYIFASQALHVHLSGIIIIENTSLVPFPIQWIYAWFDLWVPFSTNELTATSDLSISRLDLLVLGVVVPTDALVGLAFLLNRLSPLSILIEVSVCLLEYLLLKENIAPLTVAMHHKRQKIHLVGNILIVPPLWRLLVYASRTLAFVLAGWIFHMNEFIVLLSKLNRCRKPKWNY